MCGHKKFQNSIDGQKEGTRPSLKILLLNGDQHAAEIFLLFQKTVQAFAVMIRAGGIAVGVIAHEASFRMVQGNEVSAQLGFFMPAVKEDTAVGIGGDFARGHQVDYVLGEWSAEEREKMDERLKVFSDAILSYISVGLDRTMNAFNKK